MAYEVIALSSSVKTSFEVTESHGATWNKSKSASLSYSFIKKVDALILRSFTAITANSEKLI